MQLIIPEYKVNSASQSNGSRIIVPMSSWLFPEGYDSCLVAFLARKFLGKEKARAVIADSPSLKRKDLEVAQTFCKQYDIDLEIINTKELENPNYASNPIDRCYFCKYTLYDELRDIATRFPGTDILNGQNFDDLSDYRPGTKAAQEFRVLKPLADCKFTKEDIRALARYFDLSTWDKPASPCLSSRIPYGQEVTIEKLRQIEEAENMLNSLGFQDVRVRHFGEKAKIEVPSDQVEGLKKHEKSISGYMMEIGFKECEIDEEGLVSGKLNRAIA
ncbi:MAG: ATP-dependent sacrificial sulfur transferase LarE [Cyclobacteriaceae bacterium]|nr:ATP-dependent sacrificial sulfur transferase LarE [Cyclobacteriaceae bacterium]